ncbi:MAG: sigma-70 family RNA polymerase sigma factor [Defluviitaleaceae bacterium]|nr:sigma-70 family RNA polymerase sigma factor [Defluviitaleaceae bacterium]
MNVYTGTAPRKTSDRQHTRNSMDAALFEAIYEKYYRNVYNYICFRINNHYDSEELTSDAFENAIRKFHTYRPETAPVEAWLIGIAKNVVTDYLRRRKRKTFVPLDDILELVSLERRPEEVIVFNEDNKSLIRAMTTLKDAERQVLSMKFATDLRNTEIAQIMNMSDSNVGVIVHRSVKKLKEFLDKEEMSCEKMISTKNL